MKHPRSIPTSLFPSYQTLSTNPLSAATSSPTLAIVEIGSTKARYYIHRSLLEEHSSYFAKALNGPWKEAQEGVVTLEDVDCNTCKAFLSILISVVEC
jgi:hypothetical protein